MSMHECRGYVNRPEFKTSKSGKQYATFDLAVKQKRKGKDGQPIEEKLYFRCTDFSGSEPPAESSYVGVKGYLTISMYDTPAGKKGLNLDLSVKEYEDLPKNNSGAAKTAKSAPVAPEDPFALPF